jgi:hypothetical protein
VSGAPENEHPLPLLQHNVKSPRHHALRLWFESNVPALFGVPISSVLTLSGRSFFVEPVALGNQGLMAAGNHLVVDVPPPTGVEAGNNALKGILPFLIRDTDAPQVDLRRHVIRDVAVGLGVIEPFVVAVPDFNPGVGEGRFAVRPAVDGAADSPGGARQVLVVDVGSLHSVADIEGPGCGLVGGAAVAAAFCGGFLFPFVIVAGRQGDKRKGGNGQQRLPDKFRSGNDSLFHLRRQFGEAYNRRKNKSIAEALTR